jgi:cyclophilin family peptidyl-prolyl cis-trans isomerase
MLMKLRLAPFLLAVLVAMLIGCSQDNPAQSQQIALPGQAVDAPGSEPAIDRRTMEVAVSNYPKVALQTDRGLIVIALYDDKAPVTVRNFEAYVESGHYTNTVFHRVVDNLLIQGGGYDTSYRLKSEREPVRSEANNGLRNLRGTVAVARRGNDPASNGAQFFINLVDNPQFDFNPGAASDAGYTVFGQVVEGMEVVDRIRRVPVAGRAGISDSSPQKAVILQSARMLD